MSGILEISGFVHFVNEFVNVSASDASALTYEDLKEAWDAHEELHEMCAAYERDHGVGELKYEGVKLPWLEARKVKVPVLKAPMPSLPQLPAAGQLPSLPSLPVAASLPVATKVVSLSDFAGVDVESGEGVTVDLLLGCRAFLGQNGNNYVHAYGAVVRTLKKLRGEKNHVSATEMSKKMSGTAIENYRALASAVNKMKPKVKREVKASAWSAYQKAEKSLYATAGQTHVFGTSHPLWKSLSSDEMSSLKSSADASEWLKNHFTEEKVKAVLGVENSAA